MNLEESHDYDELKKLIKSYGKFHQYGLNDTLEKRVLGFLDYLHYVVCVPNQFKIKLISINVVVFSLYKENEDIMYHVSITEDDICLNRRRFYKKDKSDNEEWVNIITHSSDKKLKTDWIDFNKLNILISILELKKTSYIIARDKILNNKNIGSWMTSNSLELLNYIEERKRDKKNPYPLISFDEYEAVHVNFEFSDGKYIRLKQSNIEISFSEEIVIIEYDKKDYDKKDNEDETIPFDELKNHIYI